MAKKDDKISIAHSKIPVVLGLIGGIFTILIALIVLLQLGKEGTTELAFGIWGAIIGIVIVVSSIMLKTPEKFKLGSILLIVSSVLALITLQGLIIGPIISFAGGILTRVRKMIGK